MNRYDPINHQVRSFSGKCDKDCQDGYRTDRHSKIRGDITNVTDVKSGGESKTHTKSKGLSEFDRDDIHDGMTPLQRYSRKVRLTTGKLLAITGLTGTLTVGSWFGLMAMGIPMGMSVDTLITLGTVGWIGSAIGSLYHVYQVDKHGKTDQQKLHHAYWMQGLMGVVISPSLLIFHQFIPHALITTAALVAGPISASRMIPSGSMLPWGTALYTGLWGILGVGTMSIFAPIIGFDSLGMTLHSIDLYGGVILFSIYNAYDTHVMIDDFKKGDRDYMRHAVKYSLNIVNIFIRVLEILSKTIQRK